MKTNATTANEDAKMTNRTYNPTRAHHIELALAWRAVANATKSDKQLGEASYWNAAHRALADRAKGGVCRAYKAGVRNIYKSSLHEPDPATILATIQAGDQD